MTLKRKRKLQQFDEKEVLNLDVNSSSSVKRLKLEKESVRISTIQDIKDPLKVSSRLATFTLVSVFKNQGLFSQALEVLR